MKATRQPSLRRGALNLLLVFSSIALAAPAFAQQAATEKAPEPDAVQRTVTRARALAAVGKLAAAAAELESLRTSTADESAREVARILLVSIFIEMPDYTRASALLEEAYKARQPHSEAAARSYYALAGQAVRSVRAHVERYRTFGINVAEAGDLPAEAVGDLEQLRALLERVFDQAKTIREEEGKSSADGHAAHATALIEDAANARLRITRGESDRARWQQEVSEARQRLVASETRIGKISDAPVVQVASLTPVAPSAAANAPASQPSKSKSSGKERGAPEAARPAPSPIQLTAATRPAAGAEAGKGGPLAIGPLNARAEKKVDPSYPQTAKMARISGVVTVHVVVDEKGMVESIEKADGPMLLQAAAAQAVRRWKFRPTVVDGQPVRVSGYINFNFSL